MLACRGGKAFQGLRSFNEPVNEHVDLVVWRLRPIYESLKR